MLSGSVLIIGVGGLGAACAYMLASANVRKIGIVDKDILEISNLNRQIFFYNSKGFGKPKVFLAEKYFKKFFPQTEIISYFTEINNSNIELIIKEYDIIVDCSDNFTTKFLLNDVCFFMKKVLITASAIQYQGQILSITPGKTICLRCIFQKPPPVGLIPTCQNIGVLGAVPGIFGMLEAMEVIRYLKNEKMLYINKLFTYNILDIKMRKILLKKNNDCPLCGKKPKISSLLDSYEILFSKTLSATCENNKI